MRRSSTALATALTALLFAGCATVDRVADAPPLEGTSWVLAALPAPSGGELAAGPPVTLGFERDRVSGSDGCNRFSTTYTAQGSSLAVAPRGAASTRMACPPDVTARADAFMAALAGTASYRVEGQRLLLLAADGSVRATLTMQSQALAGTRWQATAINNGKGAVTSLVAGTRVTIDFGADGRASGSAGCNGFSAPYAQNGPQLMLRPVAATRRMCPGDALMRQEQEFLQALEGVAAMKLEGATLELRTGSGALAVALVRDNR